MSITVKDVITSFESFEDAVVPIQALEARLRKRGFGHEEICKAINKTISQGAIIDNNTGGLRKNLHHSLFGGVSD